MLMYNLRRNIFAYPRINLRRAMSHFYPTFDTYGSKQPVKRVVILSCLHLPDQDRSPFKMATKVGQK